MPSTRKRMNWGLEHVLCIFYSFASASCFFFFSLPFPLGSSSPRLFTTLLIITVALQAPLSTGFPRQEYWSGLPFPSPGDLPGPGIKPKSPALQAGFVLSEPPGKALLSMLFFPIILAVEGDNCVFDGVIYQSGETFQPSCKYQCACQDGQVGCVPRCEEDLLLPQPDCPAPRKVKVPGECCEKWICDSNETGTLGDLQTLPGKKFNIPEFNSPSTGRNAGRKYVCSFGFVVRNRLQFLAIHSWSPAGPWRLDTSRVGIPAKLLKYAHSLS